MKENLRRRTYCEKPFIERLKCARREWSSCLTRSSSSSKLSRVQPSRVTSSGTTAYCKVLSNPSSCSSLLFSSPSSNLFDIRFNEALSLSINRASRSASEILYVARRLTNLPSDGTKREFWTLVRVESVDTSGSGEGYFTPFKKRKLIHTHYVQQIYGVRIIFIPRGLFFGSIVLTAEKRSN